MQTMTYATTRTRTEAVVDQFHMFLLFATLADNLRERVLLGIENRWIDHVAVYLLADSGKRCLEASVGIDWTLHSDLANLTPTVNTDLPGWNDGAAPEIQVIGQRFGAKAREIGKTVQCWVNFPAHIASNAPVYARALKEMNIEGTVPGWVSPPTSRDYRLLDLKEMNVGIRSAGV